MQANYKYIIDKSPQYTQKEGKVLDYGCGEGDIVSEGLKQEIDIYGVEKFYGGSDIKTIIKGKGLYDTRIKEIVNDIIPFPDNYFDLVVSNQVFEHVTDLDIVAQEISRVLKPDGTLLALFPSKEVLREGHCGIALTHWLPKNSKIQYYWLLFFRALGFGYFKEDYSFSKWAKGFHEWLGKYTHYRSTSKIDKTLLNYFSSLSHIEDDYIEFRLANKNLNKLSSYIKKPLIKNISKVLCRKLGGVVLIAKNDA